MIAGGTEAAITPMGVGGFAAMRALSTRNDEPERASRPFDKDRDGFVMGEGSGVLVLEELEHARRRGAPIYAELVGYGMSADAYHITAPPEDGDGGVRVMRLALEERRHPARPGRLHQRPRHLDAVSTTGSRRWRSRRLFGEHAREAGDLVDQVDDRPPARRGRRRRGGHHRAGGQAPARCRRRSTSRRPDPECDLDYVPHTSRRDATIRYALSNSFGFGGTNGALLFKRFAE